MRLLYPCRHAPVEIRNRVAKLGFAGPLRFSAPALGGAVCTGVRQRLGIAQFSADRSVPQPGRQGGRDSRQLSTGAACIRPKGRYSKLTADIKTLQENEKKVQEDSDKDKEDVKRYLEWVIAVGIEYSRKGLKEKLWEVNPAPVMRTEMTYNLACYEALLAYFESTSGGAFGPVNQIPAATVAGILDELKEVEKAGTIQKRYIDHDFADPDGQIARFRSCLSPADRVALDRLRPGLSRNSG
jgi:hypothetical protein